MPGARTGKVITGNDLRLPSGPSQGHACAAVGFVVPQPNTLNGPGNLVVSPFTLPLVRGPMNRRTIVWLGAFAALAAGRPAGAQVRDTIIQVFPDTVFATVVPASAADSVRKGVRLCAAGDVTLGTNLDSTWAPRAAANLWARYGRRDHPDSLLSPLRGLFSDADIVLVNVEGAIGEGLATRKCGPRSTSCYAFRSPPSAAGAIRRLGSENARVIGNVANNHSHDTRGDGLRLT